MSHFSENILAVLLPRATAWAAKQEQYIRGHNEALVLAPLGVELARRAGVRQPTEVRLLPVPEIPLPGEADLSEAAQNVGLITAGTGALTIGYGVFVRQDCRSDGKLLAHELVHVAQYERHGGVARFLREYLAECNDRGYPNGPMEQEAIAFAEKEYPSSD
jgi:hypothetical protein